MVAEAAEKGVARGDLWSQDVARFRTRTAKPKSDSEEKGSEIGMKGKCSKP